MFKFQNISIFVLCHFQRRPIARLPRQLDPRRLYSIGPDRTDLLEYGIAQNLYAAPTKHRVKLVSTNTDPKGNPTHRRALPSTPQGD